MRHGSVSLQPSAMFDAVLDRSLSESRQTCPNQEQVPQQFSASGAQGMRGSRIPLTDSLAVLIFSLRFLGLDFLSFHPFLSASAIVACRSTLFHRFRGSFFPIISTQLQVNMAENNDAQVSSSAKGLLTRRPGRRIKSRTRSI
jgi:hypothetical protein